MTQPKLLAERPWMIALYGTLAGAGIVALTFAAWGATRPSKDTELAQWLPGVAGAATLIAAVVAAIFAAGAFRLEYRRETRLLDEAERAQAATFAGWSVLGTRAQGGYDGTRITHTFIKLKLYLRNGSDLPIYDVKWRLVLHSDHPDVDGFEVPGINTQALVPPRDTSDITIKPFEVVLEVGEDFNGLTAPPAVTAHVAIQFRDTAGNVWRRHADGKFEKGYGDLYA